MSQITWTAVLTIALCVWSTHATNDDRSNNYGSSYHRMNDHMPNDHRAHYHRLNGAHKVEFLLDDDVCKDVKGGKKCKSYAKKDYCTRYGKWMRRYCCKTCQGTCRNEFSDKECEGYHSRQLCTSPNYRIYLKTYCSKTCGFCVAANPCDKIKCDANAFCTSGRCQCKDGYKGSGKAGQCMKIVNGGYSSWTSFTKCTKSCGGGRKHRRRGCNSPKPRNGGSDCTGLGPESESKACNTKSCPVNGGYGKWTTLSGCTKSCGGGQRYRERFCNNPKPQNGGEGCYRLGAPAESQPCNKDACPGLCTDDTKYKKMCARFANEKTCKTGHRKSAMMKKWCKKSCNLCGGGGGGGGGGVCEDDAVYKKKKLCAKFANDVSCKTGRWSKTMKKKCRKTCKLCGGGGAGNGGYGEWSKFSGCTKTCGGGKKYRQRSCSSSKDGGKACSRLGAPAESQPCNTDACSGTSGKPTNVLPQDGCGRDKTSSYIVKRIVGGQRASKHRWMWQGALYYQGRYICGGTLLDKNIFLTAAHCVIHRNSSWMKVTMGMQNRSDASELHRQTRAVGTVLSHESYYRSRGVVANDIALIKVGAPFTLNDRVGIACLPQQNDKLPEDERCYVTGWGKLNGISRGFSSILMQAQMPIVERSQCTDHKKLTDNQFCGGSKKSSASTCLGDSGGPLVCKAKQQWFIQGIVSFGSVECKTTHRLSVFTRVSKYVGWIRKTYGKLITTQ